MIYVNKYIRSKEKVKFPRKKLQKQEVKKLQ